MYRPCLLSPPHRIRDVGRVRAAGRYAHPYRPAGLATNPGHTGYKFAELWASHTGGGREGGWGANTGHREHISIGQHRQPMVESFHKNVKIKVLKAPTNYLCVIVTKPAYTCTSRSWLQTCRIAPGVLFKTTDLEIIY